MNRRSRLGTMKRAVTIVVALGLALPVVAGASRIATGSLRSAIERATASQTPSNTPQRCLTVKVTTKDGGNWATVGFHGVRDPSVCSHYGFNGVSVAHRTRHRWHYVTAGSAMIPCGKLRIPIAVQRDLRLPCR
jgi:hypothetical protein